MTRARARVVGLVGVLGIVGVVLGVPVLLVSIGAVPMLPEGGWAGVLAALTSPDDGTLLLGLVEVVGWLGWAALAMSVVVEVIAAARGVRAPRLPGLALPQHAAHGLVAAALLLVAPGTAAAGTPTSAAAQVGTATPPVATAPAWSGVPTGNPSVAPAAPTPPTTADHAVAAETGGRGASTSPQAEATGGGGAGDEAGRSTEESGPVHVVRRGETLWSIAERHLGDGARYEEVARLNYDVVQPDGSQLTSSHWITPGWRLRLPAPETSAESPSGPDQVFGEAADIATYRVQSGDTLWSIAQDIFGAGERYPEIVEATRAHPGPVIASIPNPDVIDVGWTLVIPRPPEADGAVPEPPEVDEAPRWDAATDEAAASEAAAPTPEGASIDEPDTAAPTPTSEDLAPASRSAPPAPGPAPAAPDASAGPADPREGVARDSAARDAVADAEVPGGTETADVEGEPEAWPVRTIGGAGTLVAAGLVGVVAARRRRQQQRRRAGEVIAMPDGETGLVEQDLRLVADASAVKDVDRVLRSLRRHCAATGVSLPPLRAARLTATHLEAYLTESTDLPAPWRRFDTAATDGTVWLHDLTDTTSIAGTAGRDPAGELAADPAEPLDDEDAVAAADGDGAAPYPALVTIGHDMDGGTVLLDLEHVGSLGILGDGDGARAALAAVAVELATSPWADDVRVTVVGAYPELEDTLRSGRLRYAASVEQLLVELTSRVQGDRDALAAAGATGARDARGRGLVPETWFPEVVLMADDLTSRHRQALTDLLQATPRTGLAVVTAGVTLGEWALDLTVADTPAPDAFATGAPRPAGVPTKARIGTLVRIAGDQVAQLRPIGLALRPQLLDPHTYAHVLELVALTAQPSATGHDARHPTPNTDRPADRDGAPSLPAAPATRPGQTTGETHLSNRLHAAEVAEDVPSLHSEPGGEDRGQADGVPDVPPPAPRPLLLGRVDLAEARGSVEPSKRARLLEYLAYLSLFAGATHSAIDDAIWPERSREDNVNTRNTATSKLRAWLGADFQGQDYLPRHQAGGGYRLHPAVRSDWDDWQALMSGGPALAETETLQAALDLVRGRPFDGAHPRRYAWAEPVRQVMISQIVDVADELAARHLRHGQWRAAEAAAVVGLGVEPGMERLWRHRVMAAEGARDTRARDEIVRRLLAITDELGGDLEPETEELLGRLRRLPTRREDLMGVVLT